MATDTLQWTDTVVAVTSVAALAISFWSLFYARAAKNLADRQELRRVPKLVPALGQSFVHSRPATRDRVYAFYVSVRNPTDTDNSVSSVDLHVTYIGDESAITTVKIRSEKGDADKFLHESAILFAPPLRVAAHNTVAGWCYFKIANALLAGRAIERLELIVTDSHQEQARVEPILIQEYQDGG